MYDHDHKTFGKDSKSFVIRGRPKDERRDFSPGPGHYDSSNHLTKDRSVAHKMGGGERETSPLKKSQQNLQSLIGPGSYDYNQKTIGSDT